MVNLPPMSTDIYESVAVCQREGTPAVLAIIVAAFGSTPQKTGAKMLVKADGTTVGTVGGGNIEAQVIRTALKVLVSGTPRLVDLELTEEEGYLCGGHLRIYLEPVEAPPLLIIAGAGHVGLALAALAGFVGYRATLIDDRDMPLPANNTYAELKIIEKYENSFEGLQVSEVTSIVIATRGHGHDLEVLEAALHTPASYVGLLGSAKKREAMAKLLQEKGFSREALIRVHTPVGLSLGAVTPEEIAVSIMAQLITYRRNYAPKDFGPGAGRRLVDPNGST